MATMVNGYDDSEMGLMRQVDVAEIDAILAAPLKPFMKDSTRLLHLLTRVRSTLEAAHDTIRGLRRALNDQAAHLERVGTPTTLNPLDAVRYLNDEQKELIFDRIARDRLRNLRRLIDQGQRERSAVAQNLVAVRAVAVALSQQTDLPPHVRAEVARMLSALPQQVAEVTHPPVLDYPDTPTPPTAPPPAPAPAASPSTAPTFSDPYAPKGPAVYVDVYAPRGPVAAYVDPYAAPSPSTQGASR